MSPAPLAQPPQEHIWKALGARLFKWADDQFLFGGVHLAKDTVRMILRQTKQSDPPLEWVLPWQHFYTEQDSLLWVFDENKQKVILPQVLLLPPWLVQREDQIRVEYNDIIFEAPIRCSVGLDFYSRQIDGQTKTMFYDGVNARLYSWNLTTNTLTFQPNHYFDYLQTNLSMDSDIPPFGPLRDYLLRSHPGKIEPLEESKLANSTGINGLVFTSDGYMVFQKRRNNVSIRPGELCSGFSGTIDDTDIINTIQKNGRLSDFDATREMSEELGTNNRNLVERHFLGITRELHRGGTPEMFYSVDIALSSQELQRLTPRDNEGSRLMVYFGAFGRSQLLPQDAEQLSEHFWALVRQIASTGKGAVSLPLLTNLILWYNRNHPQQSGTMSMAEKPEDISIHE